MGSCLEVKKFKLGVHRLQSPAQTPAFKKPDMPIWVIPIFLIFWEVAKYLAKSLSFLQWGNYYVLSVLFHDGVKGDRDWFSDYYESVLHVSINQFYKIKETWASLSVHP